MTAVAGPLTFTSDERRKFIGASDVATLLDLNPYETRHDLWLRKRGELAPRETNTVMLLGRHLEAFIVEELARRESITLDEYPAATRTHATMPYFKAHPDGVIDREGLPLTVVEVKAVGDGVWHACQEEGIPSYYLPQVASQALLAKATSILFVAMHRETGDLHVVIREVDDEVRALQAWIEYEVERFWHSLQTGTFVQVGMPNGLPRRDTRDVPVVREDTAWVEMAERWAALKKVADIATAREEEARDLLRSHCDLYAKYEGGGIRAQLQRIEPKPKLDVRRLPTVLCDACKAKLDSVQTIDTPYDRFVVKVLDQKKDAP